MLTKLEELEIEELRNKSVEHRDALLAIASIMATDEGRKFFKYLFKTLEVMELPPPEMEGNVLHGFLGHLRAGNSIYKLASQAASEATALITAQIERERYEHKLAIFNAENADSSGR